MANQPFSIPTETMLRAVLVVLGCYIIYEARNVLLILFVSFILATVLHPIAKWAQKFYLPRTITILGVYFFGLILLAGVGYLLVPVLLSEITSIVQNFSSLWDKAIVLLPPDKSIMLRDALQANIASIAAELKNGLFLTVSSLLSTVQGIFVAVGVIVLIMVFAFYMVVDDFKMKKLLALCMPPRFATPTARLFQNIQRRLGGWARGQIILSFVIGVMVYFSLLLIGVPYAFALASLAFLLEFIPYVGPALSGLFGIFFALTVSPLAAIITALAYYIIQQLENNLIVPKIMERATGVDSIMSMISILVCVTLFGALGVLLGVPLACIIMAVGETFIGEKATEIIEEKPL